VRRRDRGGGGGEQLEGDEKGEEERGPHGGEEIEPRFGEMVTEVGVA
jgi:hypothetical protein